MNKQQIRSLTRVSWDIAGILTAILIVGNIFRQDIPLTSNLLLIIGAIAAVAAGLWLGRK